jgi:hypothetical protein
MCIRLKKNSKDANEISLIGQGFQAYMDHLFWYLSRSRLMTCWRRRRCQTNLGPSRATKSRLSTCWSELRQISESDGKLGLQSTGLERRALVPLQSSQPLESPQCIWKPDPLDKYPIIVYLEIY